MNAIELEHWVPDPEHPNMLKYAGQPIAQDVFEELKFRLESRGYLPDEYFIMDQEWENGRQIPKGAEIFCTADYGESEGIYLDVYLKWYEDGKPVTKSFATGKTLGESGADLDRMFLIASAITKAFRGGDFSRLSVIFLDEQEQSTVVDALVNQREKQESVLTQTEEIIRRLTGSILNYMGVVGDRPHRISDSDQAMLAIRDGDLREFKARLPFVKEPEVQDQLLLEAARRYGAESRKMTMLILDCGKTFTPEVYKDACERAVLSGDSEKVALLQEQARSHVEDLPPDFFGNLALYACSWQKTNFIAEQIVERCSTEEVLAAPNGLLENAMVSGNIDLTKAMAQKGANGDHALRPFIKCRGKGKNFLIGMLLDMGMKVSPDNYDALAACVEYNCPEIGKTLIDHGVDFEGFAGWAEGREKDTSRDTYQELVGYWHEQHQQEPGPEQTM